jgi:hypothetical protein
MADSSDQYGLEIQRLKSETQICGPNALLTKALELFADKNFDYYPTAEGYKWTGLWPFSSSTPTDLNPDPNHPENNRPDVECKAGLIVTPAKEINCD